MRPILLPAVCFAALCGPVFAEGPATPSSATGSVVLKRHSRNGWLVQETTSFRVFCLPNAAEAKRLPEACESLRKQLQGIWLGNSAEEWTPRCDIVLHPSVAGYVRELGPESRQSSGCATLDIERGKVLKRRIDLRADGQDWLTTALPHELTHVILAGQFADMQIPRWADEGIAILTEPAARQAARRAAMEQALRRAPRFAAAELMSQRQYPSGDRRDVFYGQSASLVAYLVERETPEKFLEFLHRGQRIGFERALTETYRVSSLAELDRRWHPRMLEGAPSTELFASRISRITSGQELD